MTQPSPLPWKVSNESGIRDSQGNSIVGGVFPSDAELIVKSVNLFPRLVEALEKLSKPDYCGHWCSDCCVDTANEIANEALKEVRGVGK